MTKAGEEGKARHPPHLPACGQNKQLQPVMGRWIFDRPRDDSWQNSFEWNNLWSLFTPYILEENHRQGENKEFADILNRLRIGAHTTEDIAKIKNFIIEYIP